MKIETADRDKSSHIVPPAVASYMYSTANIGISRIETIYPPLMCVGQREAALSLGANAVTSFNKHPPRR